MKFRNKVLNTFFACFLISVFLPGKNINERIKNNSYMPICFAGYNINKTFPLSTQEFFIQPVSQSDFNKIPAQSFLIGYALNNQLIDNTKLKEDPETKKSDLLKKIYLNSISGLSHIMEYLKKHRLSYTAGEGFIKYKSKQVQLGYNYRLFEVKFLAGIKKWDDPNFKFIYGSEYDRVFGLSVKIKYHGLSTLDLGLEKGDLEKRINFKISKPLE